MKFTNIIDQQLNVLNEQDPAVAPPADPAAAPADPAAAAPPPAPPPADPDVDAQAMVDVDLARRLALHLPDINSADRSALATNVTGENLSFIRDTLNSVAAIYDSPDQ